MGEFDNGALAAVGFFGLYILSLSYLYFDKAITQETSTQTQTAPQPENTDEDQELSEDTGNCEESFIECETDKDENAFKKLFSKF